jgi:non-ribosomal peptide synthetase component E (peptide arylation enzyme)
MILHSEQAIERYTASGHWGRSTLLDLLYATAGKAQDRAAVVDPADRPDLTSSPARTLGYREFSQAVDAIACALLDMGTATRRDRHGAITQCLGIAGPVPRGQSRRWRAVADADAVA